MKKLLLILLLGINFTLANAQNKAADNPNYDTVLARRLGADDRGMKQYVMAFLKTGPTKVDDKAKLAEIQAGHMKNIGKLASEGKLVVAGPFMDKGDVRGIFIFDVRSVDEARDLTNTDPAIQAGVLMMELHPFYCSAALMDVVPTHNKITKFKP